MTHRVVLRSITEAIEGDPYCVCGKGVDALESHEVDFNVQLELIEAAKARKRKSKEQYGQRCERVVK